MSIAGTIRRAGPYATDGVQVDFSFAFKVLNEEDVLVVTTEDGADTDLVYGSDYTVALNADQDSSPGGTITVTVAPDGPELSIISDADIVQPTVFTNTGGFYPRVLNDALDRLTIFIQQIVEKLTRVPLLPLGTRPVGKFPVVLANGSFGWSSGTGADADLRGDIASGDGSMVGTSEGALDVVLGRALDGAANIRARTANTAAALEALAASTPLLTGYAGDTHVVETAPYINVDNLVINGNDATIHNTNTTAWLTNDKRSAALPLGTSNIEDTIQLTPYTIASSSDMTHTLGTGEGANFPAGTDFIAYGASGIVSALGFYPYNVTRGRVLSSTADTVTLDRQLPAELLADTPVLASYSEGVASEGTYPVGTELFLLYKPRIYNLTIKSDLGYGVTNGGIIDGVFRDITQDAVNGFAFNALQNCLADGWRARARRKIFELAEGSVGTTVRNYVCTLYAGGAEVAPIFMQIAENSADCTLEDFHVSSGPNIPSTGVAVNLDSGQRNEMRNGVMRFPANTGIAIQIKASATAGNPNKDCGVRNVTVFQPACTNFVFMADGGAGLIRPFVIGCKFHGTPTTRAALIVGTDGKFIDNEFLDTTDVAKTFVAFFGTVTGWTIRGNYIPGGFSGLTTTLLQANAIYDNESDASRRLNVAAKIVAAQQTIASTTANNSYQTATFAAGDLAALDRIFVSTIARTGGTTSNKNGRLTITVNGTETALATALQGATAGDPLGFEAELWIISNTSIGYKVRYFNSAKTVTEEEGVVAVSTLASNALTVEVEYWVDNAADNIVAQGCRIIPVKPGMRSLPVK